MKYAKTFKNGLNRAALSVTSILWLDIGLLKFIFFLNNIFQLFYNMVQLILPYQTTSIMSFLTIKIVYIIIFDSFKKFQSTFKFRAIRLRRYYKSISINFPYKTTMLFVYIFYIYTFFKYPNYNIK